MTETLESRRRGPRQGGRGIAVVAAVLLAMAAIVPQAVVLAQSPDDERWRDEIDFEIEEPVEGRRIFVEGLYVSGDRASVTLKAATDLDIRVRAFGGSEGRSLRFWGSATLAEGERIDYSLPPQWPRAVLHRVLGGRHRPGRCAHRRARPDTVPASPRVEGELCTVRLTTLGWTPGAVSGVVESECAASIEHPVELQTVAGHESVTETALLDAQVAAITGTVDAVTGASSASVPFVPDGETTFRLSVSTGDAVHDVSVDASFTASLNIPIPPLTVLTHHPERTEQVTRTVSLYRPGASDSDSDTATATCDDGTTATATASAYAYVPSRTISKQVTVDVLHPEHVKAETVERAPVTGSREESLALASHVGSDDPYAALVVPEPEPEDPPAEQSPAGGLRDWFEGLGWEWPW